MFDLMTKKRPAAAAPRPLARRADEAMPAAVPAAEAAEPVPAVSVEAVTAARRRYRGVVTRQLTQYAVVEFDADEGIDPYALAEGVVAAVPDDAWQDRGEPWAYLESYEAIEPAAAPADDAAPAAEEAPKSRRRVVKSALGDKVAELAPLVMSQVEDIRAKREQFVADVTAFAALNDAYETEFSDAAADQNYTVEESTAADDLINLIVETTDIVSAAI